MVDGFTDSNLGGDCLRVGDVKFEIVGVCELSNTGKSLRFKITPVFSVIDDYYYVSVKDLEAVLSKHKKSGTVYIMIPQAQQREQNCEARPE
jgi:hypothetical protein